MQRIERLLWILRCARNDVLRFPLHPVPLPRSKSPVGDFDHLRCACRQQPTCVGARGRGGLPKPRPREAFANAGALSRARRRVARPSGTARDPARWEPDSPIRSRAILNSEPGRTQNRYPLVSGPVRGACPWGRIAWPHVMCGRAKQIRGSAGRGTSEIAAHEAPGDRHKKIRIGRPAPVSSRSFLVRG